MRVHSQCLNHKMQERLLLSEKFDLKAPTLTGCSHVPRGLSIQLLTLPLFFKLQKGFPMLCMQFIKDRIFQKIEKNLMILSKLLFDA